MIAASQKAVSLDVALQQAVAHHQAGQLQEAEQFYRAILQVQPNQPDANHNLGVLAGQVGQHAAGLTYLKTALEANPTQGQYALSYAGALLATGQAKEARDILYASMQRGLITSAAQALLQKAEAAVPNSGATGEAPAPAEIDRLIVLFNTGHYAELEHRSCLLVQQHPNSGFVWRILGDALRKQGKDALLALHKAAEFLPGDAELRYNLGNVLRDLGQLDGAVGSYAQALEIKPDFAMAHYNLGVTLQDLGQLDGAVVSYRQTLEIEPDFAEAHSNLGNVLADTGQLDDAVASYRRALEIKPGFADIYYNLGLVLHELGQLDDALANYRRALEIKPNYAEVLHSLGQCHLAMGRFSDGWQEYEYRWEGCKPKPFYPTTPLPQWSGQQPSSGDRLLVFEEQGMGDRLQFARYLPLAAERFAGRISFVSASSLLALFRRSFPGVEILEAAPIDQSAWQWQCPLLSLPLAFGTTLETIPKRVPYLTPDPVRVAGWQARIAGVGLPAATRKIGVVWKTGQSMKNAPLRSLSLQQLAPLLELPGCAWFSLQKEPDSDKAPWVASGKLIDWTEEFGDFDETAALAMNLDLVVSVDTAVVHLAGGLGLPIWLLNRHAGEWRWMRDREDSPWYPTMRIFTQKHAGDWGEVVRRMVAALTDMPAQTLHS